MGGRCCSATNVNNDENEILTLSQYEWVPDANRVGDVFNDPCLQRIEDIGEGATSSIIRVRFCPSSKHDCSYSFTHAAELSSSTHEFAFKHIDADPSEKTSWKSKAFEREYKILSGLQHKNIVRMYGGFVDRSGFFIAQQYCSGGDLVDYVLSKRTRHGLVESECLVIARQLLSAVRHMHKNGIAHRDIKPENIMFTDTTRTKIVVVDFGNAVCISPDNTDASTQASKSRRPGTPKFMAPELWDMSKRVSGEDLFRSDMWAIGVTLFATLANQYPFDGGRDDVKCRNLARMIKYDQPEMGYLEYLGVSDQGLDLIGKLLMKCAGCRMSADDAFQHSWISDCGDIPRVDRFDDAVLTLAGDSSLVSNAECCSHESCDYNTP